ncbi:MAG: ribonuclease J, partial [Oscillospiraceae bacterium]|nr:ribonuclease J [Oscillospiraceae bacterium]
PLAIPPPAGTIIHTGDFKIDTTPVSGEPIDLTRFGELGSRGVLALLCDSTNAERPGYAMSERKVGQALEPLFRNNSGRIIVTTFASNVHRLQQIIDISVRNGRRVAITGRSMENILRLSVGLGYLNIPDGALIDMNMIRTMPGDKLCIITTGSQGEPMSALYRMAFSGHKQIELQPDDCVIISATPIPGNEKGVSKVVNELMRKGADVVYERLADVHVSGHACQEELKLIMTLARPKYFVPMHGEHRHLKAAAGLAAACGIDPSRIFIPELGRVLEISEDGVKHSGVIQAGRVMVDGLGVGDVGSVVLRDRKHLASDGLIVVVFSLNAADGSVIAGPDIVTRGFVYVKESDELLENLRSRALRAIESNRAHGAADWTGIRSAVRGELGEYLYKTTKRSPMILPVIMEV